tara:strand:+ start:4474 stop:5304 length:831 start_codon:yes stop_codon:yes gene_type:complete
MKHGNRSKFAFVLSIIIHTGLFAGITYLGLDMTLPEGTVSATEMEFVEGEISVGNQTTNIQQQEELIAEKPPEPAPPPPPVKKAKTIEKAPPAEEDLPILPPKEEVAANTEEIPVDEEEIQNPDLEDYLEEPAESELAEELPEKSISNNELDEEINQLAEKKGVENQVKYGTSSGTKSHKQLTALPGNVPPDYPMLARLRRYEGTVILHFDVTKSGQVSNVAVAQSSGYSVLDQSALEAHSKWRYRPGKPGRYNKPYHFRLSGKAVEAPSTLRRGR